MASTLRPMGRWDPSWDDLLSSLIRGISIECPRGDRSVPKWDIGLVINYLAHLEPLHDLSLELLTLKTVFLVSMACSGRVSEVHAISDDVKVSADGSLVTLRVSPSFLAKTQNPRCKPDPIRIPALSDPSDLAVCPVRSIGAYLGRTEQSRGGRHTMFLPWKVGYERSLPKKRSIAAWISRTVRLAYEEAGGRAPLRVPAHELRALSTSLAFDRGVGLEEFVAAGIWRSQSTFRRRYFRDLSSVSEISVGAVVAGSRVVPLSKH